MAEPWVAVVMLMLAWGALLVAEAAWQMNEGSICGLGQAAPLPLTSALKFFPADFGR